MGGSGGGDIAFAIASGADTLLTGEMKHSQYIEAKEKGVCVQIKIFFWQILWVTINALIAKI